MLLKWLQSKSIVLALDRQIYLTIIRVEKKRTEKKTKT